MKTLKALGLALIAVVAIGAFSASAAQAKNTITATAYPATLTGKDKNTQHGKLGRISIGTAGVRFIECTSRGLEGTITGPSTTTTFTGTLDECFSNGDTKIPMTVTMNSCDFTTELTSTTSANAYIDCSKAGNTIEMHLYENEAKHKVNTAMCTYKIGPQGPLTGTKLAVGGGKITASQKVDKIFTENTVGAAGLCGIAAGKTGNSELTDEIELTGEKDNLLKEATTIGIV